MATPAQRTNTWVLNQWYDQAVAETQGEYKAGAGLWSWGWNGRGLLGLNGGGHRSSPTQVGSSNSWWKLSKGDGTWTWQTGGVKVDGTLWSWGYNSKGALGHNNRTSRSSPTQVGTDTTWNNMATDREVMAAVKTDGTLWIWGTNTEGKLGLNQAYPGLNNISSPTQLGSGTDWREAACDYDSVLATKTDGTLWAWGSGFYGELGQNKKGTPAHRSSPVQIPGTTWVRVTANTQTVLATKSDNTLWAWGFNDHGSIGANISWPQARSSPVQIPGEWDPLSTSSGRATCGALRPDGSMFTWGSDSYGSGARNNTGSRSSPIQIPGTWSEVHMGYRSGGGIKADGTLWMWGRNAGDGSGALGQNDSGPSSNRSSPMQVGTDTNWIQMMVGDQRAMATR